MDLKFNFSLNSDGIEAQHFGSRSPDYAWQLIVACGAIFVSVDPLRPRAYSPITIMNRHYADRFTLSPISNRF